MIGDEDDTQEQIRQLRRLREAHRRNLRVLQIQAAEFGERSAPPHIISEIDQLTQKLTQINADLQVLERPSLERRFRRETPTALALTPQTIVPQSINEHLIVLAGAVDNAQVSSERQFAAVQLAIQQSDDRHAEALEDEKHERERWQNRELVIRERQRQHNYVWNLAITIALVVLTVVLTVVVTLMLTLISTIGGR